MQIKTILLPIDGSIYSDHATEYAVHLATLSGAKITAVNCYEWYGHMLEVPDSMIDDLKGKAEREATVLLKKKTAMLEEAGLDYTLKTMPGAPGKILADLAKSKEYDLIIMGSHGHSDIGGLFLGSVTHKVLNTIYCPVLVVP